MFTLLEDLSPEYARARNQFVELTEITLISLQISSRQALVLTNRNLYLLWKGLFRVRVKSWSWDNFSRVRMAADKLLLEDNSGQEVVLTFAPRKELLAPVYNRLTKILDGLG